MSVEVEALREGETDGASEGGLVFLERVLRRDQLLFERLVIDAGAQLIEERRRAGLVIRDRLIERDFCCCDLRLNARDVGLVGENEEVGIADGQRPYRASCADNCAAAKLWRLGPQAREQLRTEMGRRAVRGIDDDAEAGESAGKRGDEVVQIFAVEAGVDQPAVFEVRAGWIRTFDPARRCVLRAACSCSSGSLKPE